MIFELVWMMMQIPYQAASKVFNNSKQTTLQLLGLFMIIMMMIVIIKKHMISALLQKNRKPLKRKHGHTLKLFLCLNQPQH